MSNLWTDNDEQWLDFGWVEGFGSGEPWVEWGWFEWDSEWIDTISEDPQFVECNWAENGWISGDQVCPVVPDDTTSPSERRTDGGGSGFDRRARISVVPQGSRTYRERERKSSRREKINNELIEFVVRFTTKYL